MYNKFEKGVTYYNLFKGDMGIWAENLLKVVISPSQMVNLLTAPVTLIPTPPVGFSVIPTMCIISKGVDPTGGTYAAGASTSLDIFWSASPIPGVAMRLNAAFYPFTLTGAATALQGYFQGAETGAALTRILATVNYASSPVVLQGVGGNLTTTSITPVTVLIAFRTIPLTVPLT